MVNVRKYTYYSLAKEHSWAEHLTILPKRGMGALLSVSALIHEKVPMSCLQWLDVLEANSWTKTDTKQNHKRTRSRVLTTQNTLNLSMLVRELLMIVNLFERVFSHREWHCSFTTWCGILCQHSTLSLLYCGTDLIWYDAGMTSVQFALYSFYAPLYFSLIVQSTGSTGLAAVVANWFGKQKWVSG